MVQPFETIAVKQPRRAVLQEPFVPLLDFRAVEVRVSLQLFDLHGIQLPANSKGGERTMNAMPHARTHTDTQTHARACACAKLPVYGAALRASAADFVLRTRREHPLGHMGRPCATPHDPARAGAAPASARPHHLSAHQCMPDAETACPRHRAPHKHSQPPCRRHRSSTPPHDRASAAATAQPAIQPLHYHP